jgi:hypothetical protein
LKAKYCLDTAIPSQTIRHLININTSLISSSLITALLSLIKNDFLLLSFSNFENLSTLAGEILESGDPGDPAHLSPHDCCTVCGANDGSQSL